MLDECGGHQGDYHFHERLECLYNTTAPGHSTKVGETTGGSSLYGKWENQTTQEPPLLDACGGHIGPVPDESGEPYHHHVQGNAPFTVGCEGPNDDGTLVTVAQCRAFYTGCGDEDPVQITTNDGVIAYDYWCPCFDAHGNNYGTITELAVFNTTSTITGMCTGNTGGTGDVDCESEATNTVNKGSSVSGSTVGACCASPPTTSTTRPKNVVLFMPDDLPFLWDESPDSELAKVGNII